MNHINICRTLRIYGSSVFLFFLIPFSFAQQPVSVPAPVELQYMVRANFSGFSVTGESVIKWDKAEKQYTTHTIAKTAIVGTLLETTSKGAITPNGLKPALFTEKRRKREPTTNTFNYQNNTISFSDNKQTLPLEKGVQDQASITWQLVSMARAAPEKFQAGKALNFKVTSRNDVDDWHFDVVKEEMLDTVLGKIRTIHLKRQSEKGKMTEVWLAPEKEWYPVQLNFNDNQKLQLEQTIQKIVSSGMQ